jgi:hypothetical protein
MKTIHKDYWGRYTSATTGKEARVYAKSVKLIYMDSGMTTHYNVTEFKYGSPIRWEATLEAALPVLRRGIKVDFTKHKPFGDSDEEVAMHWPDPRVNKLVMVEKYTSASDDNTTLIVFVLAAILLLVILFSK